jgi:hypothetical protein
MNKEDKLSAIYKKIANKELSLGCIIFISKECINYIYSLINE